MQKQKKIGAGLGFRITQTVLFVIAAAVFLALAAKYYSDYHCDSFHEFLGKGYYYSSTTYVDLNDDGFKNDGCVIDRSSGNLKLSEDTYSDGHVYIFISEDMKSQEMVFADGYRKIIVKFSQVYCDYSSYNKYYRYSRPVYEIYKDCGGFGYDMKSMFDLWLYFGIAFGVAAFLQALLSHFGKKSIAANDICIVLNAFVPAYGVFGLVGGVKGRMYLQFKKLGENREAARGEPAAAVESVVAEASTVPDTVVLPEEADSGKNAASAEQSEVELTSVKADPPRTVKKGTVIAFIVSYALLFLAGVLFAAVPSVGSVFSGIGVCGEVAARAYAITVGVMWIALTPTVGYLFVTVIPTKLTKKGKTLLAVFTTVLLVIANIIFFVVISAVKIEINPDLDFGKMSEAQIEKMFAAADENGAVSVKNFFEGDDVWFIPVSMVFASLAFIICHVLMLFNINTAKLKKEKPAKVDFAKDFFANIKYFFAVIGYYLFKLARKILEFKERKPVAFITVATVLLTWLVYFTSFIFSILAIALMIAVIVGYYAGFFCYALADRYKNNPEYTAYEFVNDMGCRQTVYSNDGKTFYNGLSELVGRSKDGGKHIIIGK